MVTDSGRHGGRHIRGAAFALVAALLASLAIARSGTEAQAAPAGPGVSAVAFSPSGSGLALTYTDGRVEVVDPATGKGRWKSEVAEAQPATGVSFAGEEAVVSVGRDSVVRLWDATTGAAGAVLRGHEHAVTGVAATADGSIIVTSGEDATAVVWDVATGRMRASLRGHEAPVRSVALSPDGATIATGADDGTVILWDLASGTERAVLHGHTGEVRSVSFGAQGNYVATVGQDGTLRIWSVAGGRQLRVLQSRAGAPMRAVAAAPKAGLIATGGDDNKVTVWNRVTGGRVCSVPHSGAITAISISPDGSTIASADAGGSVKISTFASCRVQRKLVSKTPVSATVARDAAPSGAVPAAARASALSTFVDAGTGGPILVVTVAADPFSQFYTEILRNEGLNEFAVTDISALDASVLANYDVVLLAATSLSTAQASALDAWVNNGGNLIATRPDPQLASLLGLTGPSGSLSDAYLRVDATNQVARGIVGEAIQFHGGADRYGLSGGTAIAELYSNATTATGAPAVTLRDVGSNGGQAAAFTFDLARSVVLTRQGNPAWAGQERDGISPIRSDDLYFGNAAATPQPDYVDLNKVAIPQADEQQRLLANLIVQMNLDKKPLPRFWYFPNGKKAAVIMTGDDHANGGTAGRFDIHLAQSPPGCSVENWECVRSTSYIYPNSPLTDAQAASYSGQGFEIAVHVNTGCGDYSQASLDADFTNQFAQFAALRPSLAAPRTNRTHCLVWSDWSSQPQVELNHGVRLDVDYYYWPPEWVNNRPGFFTGSGMPMRFTDVDGSLIDVFGAATQMTDESGQTYPFTPNALLDNAVGPEGYYGAFTVNAHTDTTSSAASDAVVAAAQARGIPVVSAAQMLTWLDGRNGSSFSNLAWAGNTLTFSVNAAAGSTGLQAMIPAHIGNQALVAVTRDGAPLAYQTQEIKGIQYAFVPSVSGSYSAVYGADTRPPGVASTTPTAGATGVSPSSPVTATFDEAVDPASVNSSTFALHDGANVIAATVSYEATTKTAKLQPNGVLAAGTTYTATLEGGPTDPRIKDAAGNALANDVTWSFTTAAAPSCPCSVFGSATPETPAFNDPNAVEVGMRFRTDIPGFVTGVRFYKGPANTGTHTGTLWSNSGVELATVTFGNESGSGWQEAGFSSPVAVDANTTYVVSYHTDSGNYALNSNVFAASGVSNPPLRALADGEDGNNGLYRYGARAFPDQSFRSSNYWVDVLFSPASASTPPPPDGTAPTVVAVSPGPGASGVVVSTGLAAAFDEAVQPESVSVNLTGPAGAIAVGPVGYDAATRTAMAQPLGQLAPDTAYSVAVRATDLAGNTMATPHSWSFTTAPGSPPPPPPPPPTSSCPCSVFSASSAPATPADPDASAIEVGMRFRTDVDGVVTGVRFYKAPTNTGAHVGSLWSATGTQLATVTFAEESASGWQEAAFSSAVAISANTTYVISYHTDVGQYSADVGGLATGVDAPPLHALANGTSANGVYAYSGTSAFPTDSWQASNYWVDLVFTPSR